MFCTIIIKNLQTVKPFLGLAAEGGQEAEASLILNSFCLLTRIRLIDNIPI